MAIHIKIHEEDEDQLALIQRELWRRRQAMGLSQREMGQISGRSEKFFNEIENGIGHPHLSSLQIWASIFDLRVQPELVVPDFAGWEVPLEVDQELCFLWGQAKQFDAAPWVRLWCVSELKWERHWRGITAAQMSRMLGLSVSAISGWERDGSDPLVSKLFTYARALGGHMAFKLYERTQWKA